MALRNSSLQGGYFIVAARALGLDCGPMSGFDNDGVDKEFFAGTNIKSNFLCISAMAIRRACCPRNPRACLRRSVQDLERSRARATLLRGRYRAGRLFGRGAGRRHDSRPSFRGNGARPCRGAGADGGRRDARCRHRVSRDLDRLAVTTGPGTFTGQRVGLAFMRGLRVALKKPLIGVTTLEAMAAATEGRNAPPRSMTPGATKPICCCGKWARPFSRPR